MDGTGEGIEKGAGHPATETGCLKEGALPLSLAGRGKVCPNTVIPPSRL